MSLIVFLVLLILGLIAVTAFVYLWPIPRSLSAPVKRD